MTFLVVRARAQRWSAEGTMLLEACHVARFADLLNERERVFQGAF